MDEAERDFGRLYAGLLARLDPDPVRSGQVLRGIQTALRDLEEIPEKERPQQ